MASLVVTPEEGDFGDTITLTGTSFAITSTITVTWDGFIITTVPTTITTDGSGEFTATITPPNTTYGTFTISASDGTNSATDTFILNRQPEYCTVKEIADYLRIPITANTDPNTSMIKNFIMDNEDDMDRRMGHTFMQGKQVTEVFDVSYLWDWSRGLPLFPRHRSLKPFDRTKGDKFEAWNGTDFDDFTSSIEFETIKGTMYVRGFLFTTITKSRFRVTYRYGGNNEGQAIPRDISKACKLLTSVDVLDTDFKMSELAYGGEGTISKDKLTVKWADNANDIIRRHEEIIVSF